MPSMAKEVVFRGVLSEPLPAFMRDLSGGLEENEALIRVLGVGAATEHVPGESIVIPFGILTAERKFEARLAIGIAVALTGIATRLREHRHHVVAEGDGCF